MHKSWKNLLDEEKKTYSYLKDNKDEGKKAKDTQNYVIKRKLKFEDYKNCLEAKELGN